MLNLHLNRIPLAPKSTDTQINPHQPTKQPTATHSHTQPHTNQPTATHNHTQPHTATHKSPHSHTQPHTATHKSTRIGGARSRSPRMCVNPQSNPRWRGSQPLAPSDCHRWFVPLIVVAGGCVGFIVTASGANASCRLAAARLSSRVSPLLLCVVVVAGGILFLITPHCPPPYRTQLSASRWSAICSVRYGGRQATRPHTMLPVGTQVNAFCHTHRFEAIASSRFANRKPTNQPYTHKAPRIHPTHPASLPRARWAFNLSYVRLRKLQALFSPHTKATRR